MSALAASRPAAHDSFLEAAREKLIVALDYSTIDEARQLVDKLGDHVTFYKVGLGLQLAGGDQFARELIKRGKRVFLDYKYFDIEETIKNAVARAAELGISFLTVHGSTSILKGAVEGRGASDLKIFCVTVLTSIPLPLSPCLTRLMRKAAVFLRNFIAISAFPFIVLLSSFSWMVKL